MLRIIAIAIIVGVGSAAAQQPPAEKALGDKLMQELNAGLACNTSLIATERQMSDGSKALLDLQQQLAEARKQIEELKKPKDDPK